MRVLINTSQDLNELRLRDENPLIFELIKVNNMVDGTYLILCQRLDADLILSEIDENYEIIGAWNDKGEFYDDYNDCPNNAKRPKNQSHKFTTEKYNSKLLHILDDEGNVIETKIVNIFGYIPINVNQNE